MALSWKDLKNTATYKEADPAAQDEMARNFFNKNVAPKLGKDADVEKEYTAWKASDDTTGGYGLGDLWNDAKEAGRGIAQTGANILNTPTDIANAGIAGYNAVTGSNIQPMADAIQLPDSLKPKDENVKLLADLAPMVIGSGGLAKGATKIATKVATKGAAPAVAEAVTGAGNATAKAIDTGVRMGSGKSTDKEVKDYIPQAEKLIANDPAYKGRDVNDVALELHDAEFLGDKVTQAGLGGTLGVGTTGGLLSMMGKGALAAGGSEAAGEAVKQAAGSPDEVDTTGIGLSALAGGIGGAVGRGINKAVESAAAKQGISKEGQKVAKNVRTDVIDAAQAGGNKAQQDAFRKATTNENGKSILNPSQALKNNTLLGIWGQAAERRGIKRDGVDSIYGKNFIEQQEGQSLRRALETPDGRAATEQLQQGASKGVNAFKAEADRLYGDALKGAQNTLDSARIKTINAPTAKSVIKSHIAADDEMGGAVLLSPEARSLMGKFEKAKIKSMDDANVWKTTLNEAIGKANRNGDYNSAKALRELNTALKDDVDGLITKIDPNMGRTWKDADAYYRENVGDAGTKGTMGKFEAGSQARQEQGTIIKSGKQRQDAADLGSAAGRFSKSSPEAQEALKDISQGRAGTRYETALENADRGDSTIDFRKLRNYIDGGAPSDRAYFEAVKAQTGMTDDEIRAMARLDQYAGVDSAVRVLRENQPNLDNLKGMNGFERATEAMNDLPAIGALASGNVPLAAAIFAGRQAMKTGAVDKVGGVAGRTRQVLDLLADPAATRDAQQFNLQKALTKGTSSTQTPNMVERGAQQAVNDHESRTVEEDIPEISSGIEGLPGEEIPEVNGGIEGLPEVESSQIEGLPGDKQANVVGDRLYKGFQTAETGGIDNPWIRTRAQDKSSDLHSSAYGPAQITYSLAEDYLSRRPELFTDEEKAYLKAFINQGQLMIAQSKGQLDDPKLAYGGEGYLTSPRAKELYETVAKKMMTDIFTRNGGDLGKTITAWRGLDDPAYARKVVAAI